MLSAARALDGSRCSQCGQDFQRMFIPDVWKHLTDHWADMVDAALLADIVESAKYSGKQVRRASVPPFKKKE